MRANTSSSRYHIFNNLESYSSRYKQTNNKDNSNKTARQLFVQQKRSFIVDKSYQDGSLAQQINFNIQDQPNMNRMIASQQAKQKNYRKEQFQFLGNMEQYNSHLPSISQRKIVHSVQYQQSLDIDQLGGHIIEKVEVRPGKFVHLILKELVPEKNIANSALLAVNNSNSFEYLFQQGWKYQRQQKYKLAIGYFERGISIKPSHLACRINLGICYLCLGLFENALDTYQLAFQSFPTNLTLLYNLIICYIKLEKYKKAFKLCDKALKQAGSYWLDDFTELKGILFVKQKKYTEEQKMTQQDISEIPFLDANDSKSEIQQDQSQQETDIVDYLKIVNREDIQKRSRDTRAFIEMHSPKQKLDPEIINIQKSVSPLINEKQNRTSSLPHQTQKIELQQQQKLQKLHFQQSKHSGSLSPQRSPNSSQISKNPSKQNILQEETPISQTKNETDKQTPQQAKKAQKQTPNKHLQLNQSPDPEIQTISIADKKKILSNVQTLSEYRVVDVEIKSGKLEITDQISQDKSQFNLLNDIKLKMEMQNMQTMLDINVKEKQQQIASQEVFLIEFGNNMSLNGQRLSAKALIELRTEFKKDKNELNMKKLLELTKGLKFFSKFTPEVNEKLFRIANYITYQQGEYVFKQGQIGDLMYVIIYGSILVKKQSDDFGVDPIILTTLYDGDTFGELALMASQEGQNKPRAASCIAGETSDLLAIPKMEYNTLLLTQVQTDIEQKIQLLKTLPFFEAAQSHMITPIAANLKTIEFKFGECLIKRGEMPKGLYVIIKGRCKVFSEGLACQQKNSKENQSQSKKQKPMSFGLFDFKPKYQKEEEEQVDKFEELDEVQYQEILEEDPHLIEGLQQYLNTNKSIENIMKEYIVFKKEVEMATLRKGDFFGGRVLLQGELEVKEKFSDKSIQESLFSVVADSASVECFIITKVHINFLSAELKDRIKAMLMRVYEIDRPSGHDPKKLYLQFNSWERYKQRLMTYIMKNKNQHKITARR